MIFELPFPAAADAADAADAAEPLSGVRALSETRDDDADAVAFRGGGGGRAALPNATFAGAAC
jgi:hypothetical protein